ncbi:MAG: acetolactate synthase large subunit [Candidatus Krumholzibacteriota bacterium]|nr:acetolactate synthase large subunit [Candidatus Krumholzibacteriota bacterium]
MKASDLFVKALEAEGVRHIFGIPGEENLDMLESIRNSDIELILTRHEQAAGFMAATYGRFTGKAGVCMATLGPGATNLVTAAVYAQLGAMPMLMVTGQKPVKMSKQGQFQIVDIVDMMRPLTKYTRQLVSGDSIPATVREAFRMMERERPGAAHIELPEDVAREETAAPIIVKSHSRRPIAEEKAVAKAVELIENAKHPLILIGAAANRKMTSKMLREFVDKTGIPFFCTQMGKGVLDELDPLYLGNATLSADDFVHRAIEHADVIINVGHDVVEKPPFFMHPGGVTVIHVNFLSASIDPVYFPQASVVGDIANAIWQMKERITVQGTWDFSYFAKVKEALEAHILETAADPRFPVTPMRLVTDVRAAMPSDGIIALDNGVYKIWFARNYPAHRPNTVLLDNALATMGAGLPSAMTASVLCPERRVMAICGDGGFMMNSQELETAVRYKLDLVVLILRDDAYGMIKWKQDQMGLPSYGLDYGNPDFVKYAESYGASGYRLEATEDLVGLIDSCYEAKGVHVIEVPVDYSDNDRILNHEIKERSAKL